jgi:hypothetical protein
MRRFLPWLRVPSLIAVLEATRKVLMRYGLCGAVVGDSLRGELAAKGRWPAHRSSRSSERNRASEMSESGKDQKEVQLPSQAGLDMVASLINEPTRWEGWLSGHRDRWDLFLKIFRLVVRFETSTGWQIPTVLSELGCQVQTTQELGRMEASELERCREYFEWTAALCELLFTPEERRRVLSGASLLFRDSRTSVTECKRSMTAGTFPAVELLKLGEIDQAWAAARLELRGPIGDRARLLHRSNPFRQAKPHLSGERLDLYLDAASGLSGEMRDRIQLHLATCTECAEACRSREALRRESHGAASAA